MVKEEVHLLRQSKLARAKKVEQPVVLLGVTIKNYQVLVSHPIQNVLKLVDLLKVKGSRVNSSKVNSSKVNANLLISIR